MDQIAQIIRNSDFNGVDIDNATCGFCGTFALALHRHLKKLGVETRLVVFYDKEEIATDHDDEVHWSHFGIEKDGTFYDIRGAVSVESIHKEFLTDAYRFINEATLVKMVRDLNLTDRKDFKRDPNDPSAHSGNHYRDWKKRLNAPVLENDMPDPSFVAKTIISQMCKESGKTPKVLNSGQCFEFADTLERTDQRFMSISIGNVMRWRDDMEAGFDAVLLKRHYPKWKPPFGLTWKQLFHDVGLNFDGIHGWAYCNENGLCYDLETPNGIENPFEFKFFQPYYENYVKRNKSDAPVLEGSRLSSFVRTDEIPKQYKQYPIIGRGTTSIVLDKGKTVLMFTRDRIKREWLIDQGIAEYVGHYSSPSHHIQGMSDFDIEILELPKLYPLSKENKVKIVKACKEFEAVRNRMTKRKGSTWEIGQENWEAFAKAVAPLKIFKNLLSFLTNYFEDHYMWDVREANFMQTARGRVVVLDPIVSNELMQLYSDHMRRRYS